MKQKSLAGWLQFVAVFLSLLSLLFFGWLMPVGIRELGDGYPEFQKLVGISLCTVWASAPPVFASLVLFWRICSRIARDRSFCAENARGLAWIGKLALLDTILCVSLTVLLCCFGAMNGGILLFVLFVVAMGIGIAVASFTLSHLVLKATQLREESELTI